MTRQLSSKEKDVLSQIAEIFPDIDKRTELTEDQVHLIIKDFQKIHRIWIDPSKILEYQIENACDLSCFLARTVSL